MVRFPIIFAVVLGINLLPAFGPPTWSVLVLYRLHSDIPATPLVLFGALAAALGRFLLALAFRRLRARLPETTKTNLIAFKRKFERKKRHAVIGLALFALSPVPSAQLFEAVGLADVPLVPLTTAFFAGRLVSYSLYVFTTTHLRETNLGEAFESVLTNPRSIAIEIGMLALLTLFVRIDWAKRLRH